MNPIAKLFVILLYALSLSAFAAVTHSTQEKQPQKTKPQLAKKSKSEKQNKQSTSKKMKRPIIKVAGMVTSTHYIKHIQAYEEDKTTQHFMGYLELQADPSNDFYQATFLALAGSTRNKAQLFINQAVLIRDTIIDADMDVFYWHLINRYWAIKGGINYVYRPADNNHTYVQPGIGIESLSPLFIQVNFRVYHHDGSTKFDLQLSRDFKIFNKVSLQIGLRGIAATKTIVEAEIGSGFNLLEATVRPYYQLSPSFTVYFEYEHDQVFGVLKRIIIPEGGSASSDTYSIGLAALF